MNNDVKYRTSSSTAGKEIKASAHYNYITNGITLDGSKFTASELVLEGQCLVRDNATKKYEKYADGNAAVATLTGTTNITAADLAGIDAGTSVKWTVDGVDYVIANTPLAALTAVGGAAAVIAAVKAAVNSTGTILDDIATVANTGSKLVIALNDASGKITFTGTYGVAGDKATVEGVLGMVSGVSAVSVGSFPAGKSNPVILDESIKFKLDDDGNNPDLTAGQVLVHGAVYTSMLLNCTDAFKAALAGAIRFVE